MNQFIFYLNSIRRGIIQNCFFGRIHFGRTISVKDAKGAYLIDTAGAAPAQFEGPYPTSKGTRE